MSQRPKISLMLALLLTISAPAMAAPDLTGPWEIDHAPDRILTADGKPPPLLPTKIADYQKNQQAKRKDPRSDPVARCLPPGVPRLFLQKYPFNLVQGLRTIAVEFAWNHLSRVIFMDRDHFDSIGPLYLGQSIGHWEGATLVVDTNSYNDTSWLDDSGLPHSDQLRTIEHIRLISGGDQLEDRVTIDDPATYAGQWDLLLRFRKMPGALIQEDYCLGRSGRGGQ